MRDDIKVIGIIIINNHDNDTNSYANDDYGSSCCFRSRYNRVGNEGGQRGAASVNSGLKLAASREMCVIAMSHSELVATHSCPELSLFRATVLRWPTINFNCTLLLLLLLIFCYLSLFVFQNFRFALISKNDSKSRIL